MLHSTALNHQAGRSGGHSLRLSRPVHCHAGYPPYPQYEQTTFPGYQQAPFRSAPRRPVSTHAYQPRARPEPEVATVVYLDADGEPVHIWGLPQLKGCSFCREALEGSGFTQKLHLRRPCGLCSFCMHHTNACSLNVGQSASRRGGLVIVHVHIVTDVCMLEMATIKRWNVACRPPSAHCSCPITQPSPPAQATHFSCPPGTAALAWHGARSCSAALPARAGA